MIVKQHQQQRKIQISTFAPPTTSSTNAAREVFLLLLLLLLLFVIGKAWKMRYMIYVNMFTSYFYTVHCNYTWIIEKKEDLRAISPNIFNIIDKQKKMMLKSSGRQFNVFFPLFPSFSSSNKLFPILLLTYANNCTMC